jgi:hypothetical protein
MEEMMTSLLAEISINREKTKTNQAKTDANLEEIKEEMRTGQKLLKEEMLEKLETNQERMMITMDTQLEEMEAAVDVFEERLKKMNTDFEEDREKSDAVSKQQDDPEVEAGVATIRELVN